VAWLGALLVGFSVRGFFPEKIDYAKIGLGILFILLCSSYWLFARQPFGLYSLQLAKYSNFNNDYLIDANQKSFNMDYKSLYQNNSIKKLQPIIIPPHPLNSFFIVFQAQTPKNTDKNLLGLFINETLIATKPLTYGPMVWSEEIGPTDQFTIFSYHVLDENKKILEKDWKNIPIDSIHLSGFTNLENVLNVKEVSPHCSQQKNSVYCELNVADKIHMMELPVYYFPDMLEVVLNGKKIHYQSIYYHDYLLTTVTPLAGKNNIQITFRGLVWANVLSLLFWGIWLGILIYVLGSWIKPRSSPMNGRRE
jgi:hypothetical protein